MTRNTDLLQANKNSNDDTQFKKKDDIVGSDYLNKMFQDGHNRTASKAEVKSGPEYDRAVHTPGNDSQAADQEIERTSAGNIATAIPLDTFHSRDGTDAAGLYDKTGGPLGGTEDELDDLETSGAPVDRHPHIKD